MVEIPDNVKKYVETAARTVQRNRKFNTYFDAEDVVQDLLVWLMEHPAKLEEWTAAYETKEEQRHAHMRMLKSLYRKADRICRDKKAQAVGYEAEDEQFYPTDLLEELIGFALDGLSETRKPTADKVSGGGDPSTRGNFITSLIDTRKALEQLDPDQYILIKMKYQENLTLGQIADIVHLSDSTISRRIKQSLKQMSKFLGGHNPNARGYIPDAYL